MSFQRHLRPRRQDTLLLLIESLAQFVLYFLARFAIEVLALVVIQRDSRLIAAIFPSGYRAFAMPSTPHQHTSSHALFSRCSSHLSNADTRDARPKCSTGSPS